MSRGDHRVVVTAEGLKKLQQELDELTNVRRPAVRQRIREARSLGDLRENFDFHDAKREQAYIEGRIRALQEMIGRARVVDEGNTSTERVDVGCAVDLLDLQTNLPLSFAIVGAVEANPVQGLISHLSPVGKALIGKREGDEVEVVTPRGKQRYRVTAVRPRQ
ncbi:MAG: transcription elongation factor GreA [Armatimonadota bacterium]|jgi:transcription elongation factor GreA|nr:transcription elongation factor GreA [Armatimonadota bacterium]